MNPDPKTITIHGIWPYLYTDSNDGEVFPEEEK